MLHVLAGIAVRNLVSELAQTYEETRRTPMALDFALNPAVAQQIHEGATPDIAITNERFLRELAETGAVASDSIRAFARVPLALGQRIEMQAPLCTEVELRGLLSEAESIAYTSEGTSGIKFLAALEELGIRDEVENRLLPMNAGEPARNAAAGKVDLAAAPLSVVLETEALNPIGVFPSRLGTDIDVAMALTTTGKDRDAAHDFLNFLRAKQNDPVLKRHGAMRFELD
ncbi:molybdate ABC transporter substrate-binding protein [Pseudooceanicola sp. LIPI14-2-Ac024]|uniref:molybdate ABC transporter substrate-binding protein n=1 Tax=Pseudooceanicola sp. LIPI14-2-Ac024 TaxID=3344875 RepID=UPI0035CFBFDD